MTSARAERRTVARPPRESRHRAREAALQMLYQWEVGRLDMAAVNQTFWPLRADSEQASEDVQAFATRLAAGVADTVASLDPMIVEAAEHWRLERLNVLDRLILRLAIYELLHEPGTPSKVVINEALELARTFSGDDAVRFVNGVLDAVRRRLERS
jgi:N utilization substance protein B